MEKQIRVPRYLIHAISYPLGRRLDPRPKPKWDVYTPPQQTSIQLVQDTRIGFDNWEYRFWMVDRDDNGKFQLASCRCCEAVYFGREDRRPHLNEKKCSTKLLEAFKLLLKDKKCVMCDKYTSNTEWGVPLCVHGDCIDRWKFAESQPPALQMALMLACQGRNF